MGETHQAWPRTVAHADMDAFYAAVEQLDDPALRGKPLLVGGAGRRGVVLTASYEARPTGARSAMPMFKARRLCPDALIVPPRFGRYQEVSGQIMNVFQDFSPDVEAISLDEAFLEMTGAERVFGAPDAMGRQLKDAIREATGGLTASIGISGTKYVAKVASGYAKPDGLTIVPPPEAQAWLAPQPVSRLWGAGPKTQARLHALGFQTIGQLAQANPEMLAERLGSAGAHFYALAHGEDPRRVEHRRRSKSIGSERTLGKDIRSAEDIKLHLRRSAETVGRRLRAKGYLAHGVRVKLKTSNFQILTRQRQLEPPADTEEVLYQEAVSLLGEFEHPGPFRLIGLAAYDLSRGEDATQLELIGERAKRRELETAIDDLIAKFDAGVVRRAKDLLEPAGRRMGANLDFLDEEESDEEPHRG